jgi:putative ABC transport system permease protein
MRTRSILGEAAAALNFNRQRSLLTIVSLAWGVACFVILYSYGEGFGYALETAFHSAGQDLVLMFGGQTSEQAGGERAGRKIRFNLADAQMIRDNVPLVSAISAEITLHKVNVIHNYRQEEVAVRAVEPPYEKVRSMTMESGRWISGEDYQNKRRVAILGAKPAAKLFGELPPEGETISVEGLPFQVIGVLKTKTQLTNYNEPDNECIFIPLSSASVLRDIRSPSDLVWMPANPVFRQQALTEVKAALGRVHNFSPNDDRALVIFIYNEIGKVIDTLTLALRTLLGVVGTLTLVIGGVGLANIMLVAVTQRTREIGILKSIGATRGAILLQFLAEAMAIVTLGGLLGVLLGWGATSVIQTLPLLGPMLKDTTGQGDIHLHISRFAVLVSTGVLETIGLIAGLLPAVKASRLDPIESLRYE